MHKIFNWLEFWFLLLVQTLCIGWYLTILFPATAVQAQTANTPAAEPPAKLGSFLDQYPVTKSQAKLLKYQTLMQLGQGAFAGYRAFKDKQAGLIAYKARESFGAECAALGGHIEGNANRADIAAYFSMAKRAAFNGNDLSVCVDADELPLGALIASTYANRHKESFVRLFAMTQETATEMMAIYHRGMAKELRFQADMVERKINNEASWEAWREKLAIGTETNCGPVIGLRGPMIEIAHSGQPSWLRREQLFPVGARDTPGSIIRCGTSDPM
jgi:hypothetical protein